MNLGPVGVWWSGSWKPVGAGTPAAELEALGYGALWSSGGLDPGFTPRFDRLLAATDRVVVASGIVNIWKVSPEELARGVADLDARYPSRFLLGLGASHAPLVENYAHPYRQMVEYLDALDGLGPPVQSERRILAALGPRMLELAATRARGAHPYFVPVEHTARARALLGTGPLLAPEVTVVLEPDPGAAREQARAFTAGYLTLPNYVKNLRWLGFEDDELVGGGSDRLVDALVPHGDPGRVAARIREHHDAGADHVAVQVLGTHESVPLEDYRALASILVAD